MTSILTQNYYSTYQFLNKNKIPGIGETTKLIHIPPKMECFSFQGFLWKAMRFI
jgi:hypothetical protein